jgi:hypothetical protein
MMPLLSLRERPVSATRRGRRGVAGHGGRGRDVAGPDFQYDDWFALPALRAQGPPA